MSSTPEDSVCHQVFQWVDIGNEVVLVACEKLREPCDPIPQVLGEDRLARFGAYREFQ